LWQLQLYLVPRGGLPVPVKADETQAQQQPRKKKKWAAAEHDQHGSE
jgi:hypothetical protein